MGNGAALSASGLGPILDSTNWTVGVGSGQGYFPETPPIVHCRLLGWARMADEAQPERRKRYRHWSLFPKTSVSYEKLGKRVEAGVCIGCGKDPCECKNPRRKRR